jgi:hypothetical protein
MKYEDGIVKLSDGSIIKLRITIVDAREAGFSPFGGINILVKVTGGIAIKEVPEDIRKQLANKPLPPGPEPPQDGWEIIDITEYTPAIAEELIETSKGPFAVMVKAEPVMASRNVNYKNEFNEPIYWLNWVYKISWKPSKGV